MLLEDCTIGTIVCKCNNEGAAERVGHIKDLTLSDIGEVIPLVSWADDKKYYYPVHHGNLTKLKDYMLKDINYE